MRICHITTAHPRFDVRIFHKECVSLANVFKDVHLVVADGLGDESVNGVQIHDIGKPKGRKGRFLSSGKKALKVAVAIKADIYHFHDPELLRIVKKLKNTEAKVIFDSHEDVPRQILNKTYIPKFFRRTISSIFEKYENKIVKKISGVIAATPHIRDRFIKVNKNCIDINNYPKKDDIAFNNDWSNRANSIGYIGGIFRTRGIIETLDAINGTDIKLILAGAFSPPELEVECKSHPGWKNVDFRGYLDRKGINQVLGEVRAGMVILEATQSYIVSLPVKMFEYMAAGLPVIASDFPLWNQIIESTGSGICVDQTNSEEISNKLSSMLSKTDKLKKMGENGRKAVEEFYNWELEEKKLFEFYETL